MIKQLIVKIHSQKISYAKLFIIALITLFIFSLVSDSMQVFSSRTRIMDAQSRLEKAKEQNEKLKKELSYVMSKDFDEVQARDKLGLSKKGEIIVVMPDDDVLRKLSPRRLQLDRPSLPDPTWKKWVKLFTTI